MASQYRLRQRVVKREIKSIEKKMLEIRKAVETDIGEIPDAFDHARDGLTNAYIMYRKL